MWLIKIIDGDYSKALIGNQYLLKSSVVVIVGTLLYS